MSWLGHGPTSVLNRETSVSRAGSTLADTTGSSGPGAAEVKDTPCVHAPALLVVSVTPRLSEQSCCGVTVGRTTRSPPHGGFRVKEPLPCPPGGNMDLEVVLLLEF